MADEPIVDLHFLVTGQTLPVDHGFSLFGAVSRHLPEFHEDAAVGMRLIRGRYLGGGLLGIFPRAELVFRMPVSRIPVYLRIAGKDLDVSGHKIRVGVPQTRVLVSATALYAHIVTTKNGHDQDRFRDEVTRQLTELNIKGKVTIGRRRTFEVHGKQVVGYSMLVSELTAMESIVLQEEGLGGRRKMGCGFFEGTP